MMECQDQERRKTFQSESLVVKDSEPEFKFLVQHLYPGMAQEKGVALDDTLQEAHLRGARGDEPPC